MTGLELVVNPDPVKSEVMTRAGELRDEGYDRSEALSMAWDDILGDDYGEDDEDDAIDLDLIPQSRKRRRRNMTENPIEGLSVGTVLLVASVAYVIWCGVKSGQMGAWTWTPWKASIGRRLPVVKPIQQIAPPTVYPSRDGYERVTLIVP